jgi:hypothetical protein
MDFVTSTSPLTTLPQAWYSPSKQDRPREPSMRSIKTQLKSRTQMRCMAGSKMMVSLRKDC